MLLAYYPETDRAAKHTNKTVNQILHYHVDQQWKGWIKVLSRIHFCIMNTVKTSTGYSLFQLHSKFSLQLISPLIEAIQDTKKVSKAFQILKWLQNDIKKAQYSLMATKI